jgi:hypothetical protein
LSAITRGKVDGGAGGGGGATGTIGAAVPATANPIAVKDNLGNLQYPQVDASGKLIVAVTGAGSGGTSSVDNSVYAAGTTAGTPLMGAVDDTGTTAAIEDDIAIVRITPQRGLHANLRTAAGAEIGTSGSPVRTDPTGTTTQPVKTEQQLDFDTGAGTQNQSLVGIALPASGGPVAGGTSTNPLRTDPTGTTTQPVSAASLPLPALAATSTKQSDGSQKTQIVDGSGNVIGATANALDVNIKSGSVTANAGTNLNTSALALEAGNLATIAGAIKAEDAAHASGHSGIMALAVRQASPADMSAGATDGDYEPLQIGATGRLWASATIDSALPAGANAIGKLAANAGVNIGDVGVTAVTPGTGATALGKAEDAAHTSGDVGVMALAVRSDAGGALAGTDGDYIPLSVDASGQLRVTGGGGGTQYTEDAVAAADPVGNAAILVRKDTPAATVSADGDNIAQRGSNFGAAYVTLLDTSGNPVAVGGGTQYTEDAAAAADPIGTALNLIRKDTLAGLTSADGDNVAARGTDKGELYVKHADPLTTGSGKTIKSKTGSASATFTIVAAVASKRIKVTGLSLMTSSTTPVTVTFKDAAAGTGIGTYILQAITGTNFGISDRGVSSPDFIFATSASNLLEMSFSAAVAVTYNLTYFDDDAS